MSDDETEKQVTFTKNKRLIDEDSGHVGGALYNKPEDPYDSPKLNKRGMSLYD